MTEVIRFPRSGLLALIFTFILAGYNIAAAHAAPAVSIGAPSKTVTNGGPVNFVLTYSGHTAISLPAAAVEIIATGTASAALKVVTGSGDTRTVTLSNISGDGTLAIAIAEGTAADGNGVKAPAAGPSQSFVVDNTPPTITFSQPDPQVSRNTSVVFGVQFSGAEAINLSANYVSVNTTGSLAYTNVTVSGTGQSRLVHVNGLSGAGLLSISLKPGAASDEWNDSVAAGPSPSAYVDVEAPMVHISPPSLPGAREGSVSYTVTHTGCDHSFLLGSHITVNKTGTAETSGVTVSGEGNSHTVTLNNISGKGTLGISIAAGTGLDVLSSAPAAGPSDTFFVDDSPPSALILPPFLSTRAGTLRYEIYYSGQDSITLDKDDVEVQTTGSVTYTGVSTGVAGESERYVNVQGVTGDGTVSISLKAGTASDTVGQLPAVGPSSATKIDAAPVVTISAPSAGLTNSGPVSFEITFAQHDFQILTNADITVNATGTASATPFVSIVGSFNSRTVTLQNISGDGTLGISIRAGVAQDTLGGSPATGPSASFRVDNTPPSVTVKPLPVYIR